MTLQKKATVVASATSTLLIIIKFTIGILSGSVAVLASAVDSVLDLIVSLFNFFAITKSEQPADEEFNYGRGKIEALAAVIEGTVITISGLYILYEAISKAIHGRPTELIGNSIIVMLISLVITISLVVYLNYVAKKTGSMVIKADALHYKTDIITNGAILFSLVAIKFSGFEIIDSIVGGLIAIYIIYEAYKIIKEGVYVLLDGALEDEMVHKIKYILDTNSSITSYHFLKTRQSGHINFVDAHLVFTPETSLLVAHRISDQIEESVQSLDDKHEWVINMHLDPYDDSEMMENPKLHSPS